MKIYVYAIAKNEEKFADRFMDSAREADGVCILDTGSEDRTVELLADRGARVQSAVISPFRFDEARNRALALVPLDADVCVCLDMDEVLSPGWRRELEQAWGQGVEQARFTCVRSRNGDGSPGCSFLIGRAHARRGFRWEYPVHEVLAREDGRKYWRTVDVPEMVAEHFPDARKDRSWYLELLKTAVQEYPHDPRCAHYLGREYMYQKKWANAIFELECHLKMYDPWSEQRAASMRCLSECWLWGRDDPAEAMRWALRSAAEAPHLREGWFQAEKAAYYLEDWDGTVFYGRRALTKKPSLEGINDGEAWGAAPFDLLSIAQWKLGHPHQAYVYAKHAARLDPGNQRIARNAEFLLEEGAKACESPRRAPALSREALAAMDDLFEEDGFSGGPDDLLDDWEDEL